MVLLWRHSVLPIFPIVVVGSQISTTRALRQKERLFQNLQRRSDEKKCAKLDLLFLSPPCWSFCKYSNSLGGHPIYSKKAKARKEEEEDFDFEDEVEVPFDLPARIRFQK